MTRGRQMLLAILQRTTAFAIAGRCAFRAPRRVIDYANGERLPCIASRLAMQREYGIPWDAWDRAASRPVARA